MHDTAKEIGRRFFEVYAQSGSTVVELGAFNVNGSLRDVCPKHVTYIGLDVSAGPGVDVVVKPDAPIPLTSNSADIVVSSSMFEHDTFFWETFLEMARITKTGGVIYINSPSNGKYHCFPRDNWRFYPDAGKALVKWAAKNGHKLLLVESFIAERQQDVWNDFVAIFEKGDPFKGSYRFISDQVSCTNVWRLGDEKIRNERASSEDMVLISRLKNEAESDAKKIIVTNEESSALAILLQRLKCEIEQLRAATSENAADAGRRRTPNSRSRLSKIWAFIRNTNS